MGMWENDRSASIFIDSYPDFRHTYSKEMQELNRSAKVVQRKNNGQMVCVIY